MDKESIIKKCSFFVLPIIIYLFIYFTCLYKFVNAMCVRQFLVYVLFSISLDSMFIKEYALEHIGCHRFI